MATPLITTQQQDPMQSFDPFANTRKAQAIAAAKKRYDESRAQYAILDQQRNAAGVGSPEYQRISDQMHQMNLQDINNQKGMEGLETVSGTDRAMPDEWVSLIDPTTGKLQSNYQLSQYNPNEFQGYQQFQQEALRQPGQQSAWAGIQQQKLAAEEAQAKDAAAKQAMSASSQALGSLAMRGGAGSGASTSLARDMQRQLLNQRQAVGRQGMMSRFDLASKDEEARQRNLGQLVGYEKDIAQGKKKIEESNLNRLMQEIEGRRAFESDKYKNQMREWGANRESAAVSGGGGGGK